VGHGKNPKNETKLPHLGHFLQGQLKGVTTFPKAMELTLSMEKASFSIKFLN